MQPADSLPGTYAGQYWYANPATSPWVITPDTYYVQNNLDTVNCMAQVVINFGTYNWTYYTDYYSCNSPAPSNYYMKFYSVDSLRTIADNSPQPPPNQPISMRFYGKRISNKTVGVNEVANKEEIMIYPNPVNGIITIKSKILLNEETEIKITDVLGKEIKNQKVRTKNEKAQMEISDLKTGIYILNIKNNERVITKKIIIQH